MTQFDYDVFISYAHIDNATLQKGLEGWIDMLHKALELRLAQLLGEAPRIWRDQKLAGNDRFDDEIVDQLVKAAVLVAVLSPRYVKSEWCTREVEEFRQTAERTLGETVANKSRIFKVVKTPVPLEEHPAVVQGLLGYKFFDDDGKGRPREFARGFGEKPEPVFWDKLDDLAYEVRDLLSLIKTETPSSETAAAPPTEAGATVYLAEATSDLDAERDQIRRELLAHGHTVVPDQPLPLRGDVEGVIEGYLERSSLSIHLAGATYDIVPEGHEVTLTELQAQLAAKRGSVTPEGGKRNITPEGGQRNTEGGGARLVWIPPGLEIADERQRQVVDALRNDPDLGPGDSVLETSLDELKNEIEDQLRATAEEEHAAAAPAADEPATIYLMFDQADIDAVAALEDFLWEQEFDVIVPLFDGDEATVAREHQDSLHRCHAVLLYQGEATDAWLRTKLRDLRKAPAGRDAPLDTKAIFLAAPETPQKARYRSREVDDVIKRFDDFEPEALAPFLERLERLGRRGGQG